MRAMFSILFAIAVLAGLVGLGGTLGHRPTGFDQAVGGMILFVGSGLAVLLCLIGEVLIDIRDHLRALRDRLPARGESAGWDPQAAIDRIWIPKPPGTSAPAEPPGTPSPPIAPPGTAGPPRPSPPPNRDVRDGDPTPKTPPLR